MSWLRVGSLSSFSFHPLHALERGSHCGRGVHLVDNRVANHFGKLPCEIRRQVPSCQMLLIEREVVQAIVGASVAWMSGEVVDISLMHTFLPDPWRAVAAWGQVLGRHVGEVTWMRRHVGGKSIGVWNSRSGILRSIIGSDEQ